VREITAGDGGKLALHFKLEEIAEGLSFYTGDGEFLQVGTWRYGEGKVLAAHNHNRAPRQSDRTQEFIWVAKGSLKAQVFDESDGLVAELQLGANEGVVFLAGGHGYHITSPDTVVIEVKNGPYPGAEADRRRLGNTGA